jgi:hypothetical protein
MSNQNAQWVVECEEGKGTIPLKKVRSVEGMILEPSWPDEFEIDCPYCGRKHSCIKQEITIA